MGPTSDALTVARRHVVALAVFALASIAIAWPIWIASLGPEGRDAFYTALAIQFAVWGVIDLGFALHGLPSLLRMSHADSHAIESMRTRTLAALRISGRLNLVYLAVGVALLAAGYHQWSATLCGHGIGVLLQAIPLTLLDASFRRGLLASGSASSA